MKNIIKTIMITASAISMLGVSPLQAAGTGQDLFNSECSDCHMAFPAEFLPMRSWSTIMATLDNHFGEDATLEEADRVAIEAYLVANATDAGGRNSWMLRGIGENDYVLRITEMPWWVREHSREVSQRSWDRAGTKSNCLACHRAAAQRNFDDD